MKWTEAYTHSGSTIAVPVKLIHAIGAKGAILVAQLFYWKGRGRIEDGWIYKTKDELTEETGLSLKEQRKCVADLKKLKVLETNYDRLEHRMHYRICDEALDAIMEADFSSEVPKGQKVKKGNSPGHLPFGQIGNGPKGRSGSAQKADRHIEQRLLSETTSRETTKSGSRSPAINGNGAAHGVVVVSFFVSEEDEPAEVLDKLSEKFGLNQKQQQLIAMHIDDEGLGWVIEKAKIVLSQPRDNLARAFMSAIKDDWKAPKPSEPVKRPKVLPAAPYPVEELSDEEWNRKREYARAMKAALSSNQVAVLAS